MDGSNLLTGNCKVLCCHGSNNFVCEVDYSICKTVAYNWYL